MEHTKLERRAAGGLTTAEDAERIQAMRAALEAVAFEVQARRQCRCQGEYSITFAAAAAVIAALALAGE